MTSYFYILEKFNKKLFDGKDFSYIASKLNLKTKTERNQLRLVLESLEKDQKIMFDGRIYRLFKKVPDELIEGIVRCNARGFAFLQVEGQTSDYFIPPRALGDALDGDKVSARRVFNGKSEDEVAVVKVIERGTKKLTGVFVVDGKFSYVRPDKSQYLCDIVIPFKNRGEAKTGDKVYVELTDFPQNDNPIGKVVEVLGKNLELHTELKALIIDAGVEQEFDEKTVDEAKEIKQEVGDNELIGRLDLRNKLIFTIDGETARDFDDAVSLEKNERDNFILGVHIADVSNYVKPDNMLGRQAFDRATSIYLPNKVIPMLPFELSNGICSLNENVTRLTMSVIAEIDKNGEVLKVDFYKSAIKSKHRMTYTNVQKIIDGDKEICEQYSDIVDTVLKMNDLKNIFEAKRRKQGEIDLNVKESDIFEDENGKITIKEHQTNDATRLIEQFMIFANEMVAEHLFNQKLPAIYRVHDKPSPEKVETFRIFCQGLGINNAPSGENPIEYQQLLDELRDKPTYGVVNQMMLRSMQKAEYSDENIGHFGLASKCYLHFTSPIRRFPDLVVHRILKDLIEGKKEQLNDLYGDFVVKASTNSSLMERRAELLERQSDDLYKVYYMQDYIGCEFDGIVSGVTNFGVFVELENSIEGLIRIEDLPRGEYKFIAERMRLESYKLSFTLGEKVHIGVLGVDIAARRIEFISLPMPRKNDDEHNNKRRKVSKRISE